MSNELIALAERCEAATGPDRTLDRDIEIAIQNIEGCGYDDPRDNITARPVLISHGAQPHNYEISAFSGISLRTPREYTSSVDGALALVPEGRILRQYAVSRFVPHTCEVAVDYAHGGWIGHSDHTFALALCAAALRARAALQPLSQAGGE